MSNDSGDGKESEPSGQNIHVHGGHGATHYHAQVEDGYGYDNNNGHNGGYIETSDSSDDGHAYKITDYVQEEY